ncbi:hypothetical protein EMPS_08065 [Entomortierella parvispora]|uniref:Rho-GAP domain-containing protein n=1 Tax=Entomortierella parvispora TaxID=205924 RepID=A0A9P3HG64_9FUNG|nr:hypothetical protein EMPS_08065 [Entomortierella parvispora]
MRSSSNGNLSRAKSVQKKNNHDALPELSMEMTLVIVKRCVKEIRERGLTTKHILRQAQMAMSPKVIMNTIQLILDDEANSELSALRQVDIHLVAHAMKCAIRYSEETLVTYADYQALYLDQDRSFSAFVRDLPPTNRAILLDLFSLCADVTLLAHLNNMTLVAVAKAISLSVMGAADQGFSTFDVSLQQRNMCGAACEDLLRAFLRIKTTHDLAKIEQEDEVDENRYVDNVTRQVRSARQRSNDNGTMPSIPNHSRPDMPGTSGTAPNLPQGWPSATTPTGTQPRGTTGYFDHGASPRSASPLSQHSSSLNGSSLSRSHSLAKSNSSNSRPISPAPHYDSERLEYEELMQDQSNLSRLRQQRHSQSLMPEERDRRRSSVADMESLYMLPVDASTDGYESEPEPSHESIIPDFADGLGWDFSKMDDLHSEDAFNQQSLGVNRSNSSSSNGSASDRLHPSPGAVRFHGNQEYNHPSRVRELQDQQRHSLQRAQSQQELSSRYRNESSNDILSPSMTTVQRSATSMSNNKPRFGQAIDQGHTSSSISPQRAKRNSLLRRSVSLDPHTMHGRVHKRPNELRHDILSREMAIQAERSQVAEDIRSQLLQVKQSQSNTFSLESSPQDLERPLIPTRSASQGLGRSSSRASGAESTKLEINVGGLPLRPSAPTTSDALAELTPVSNPASSGSSIASPKAHPPTRQDERLAIGTHARPKEGEISVVFTPITPVSPKADQRSKFQESFPERPISPLAGYTHKRSPTASSSRSGHSNKLSPSSSAVSSPRQHALSRSNSKNKTPLPPTHPPLQQSVSFSGMSTSSNQAAPESKSKAAGFIRALSYKLRSKQSDEQLKPFKINNQVVSAAGAPSVSIQPPRLELSFLGEVGGNAATRNGPATASVRALQSSEANMPPTSAPATLLHLDGSSSSGPGTLESWRKAAQDSLPITAAEQQQRQQGLDRLPKGFSSARRSSGVLSGSVHVANREQRRRSKITFASPRSVASNSGASSKSDDDSGHCDDGDETKRSTTTSKATSSSPNKTGEREYRFSTATLLKDGKLYYQLQWDEFSSSGFKSEFFDEPERYLTGLHQKRMSKVPAINGPGTNKEAAEGMLGISSNAAASSSWDHTTGPIDPSNNKSEHYDSGPSQAQRAAAMKAARESFMALAKDPKALAALKAGSTGGIGQATIIGTGSFPIGSTQPLLQSQLNLNWDAVSAKANTMVTKSSLASPLKKNSSRVPQTTPPSSRPLRPVQEDEDRPQENMSERLSPRSSTGDVSSQGSRQETKKHGKLSTPVGGAGSLSSSQEASAPAKDLSSGSRKDLPPAKPTKRNRLFFKASNKNHRHSVTINSDSVVGNNTNGANMSAFSRKKRPIPGMGAVKKDAMIKTEEPLDEIFPWTCIEHMTGQESGWVMLEPVQNGAVGWVKIDKLEEEMARFEEQKQQQRQQKHLQYQSYEMEREQ